MTILQPDSGLYIAGHYAGHTGHYTIGVLRGGGQGALAPPPS